MAEDIAQPYQKYRWKLWMILANLWSLLFTIPTAGLGIVLFLMLRRFFIAADIGLLTTITSTMILGGIVLVAGAFIIYLAMLVGRAVFSYLAVSSAGLDYRYGLGYRLQCTWDDVERIGQLSILFFTQDVLFLKDAEASGLPLTVLASRAMSPNQQFVMYVGRFRGWPEGQLADDLRYYAPHLFEHNGE